MKKFLKINQSREAEAIMQSIAPDASLPAEIGPPRRDLAQSSKTGMVHDARGDNENPISWGHPPAGIVHLLAMPDGSTEELVLSAVDGSLRRRGRHRQHEPLEPMFEVSSEGQSVAMVWRPLPDGKGAAHRQRSDKDRLVNICEWRQLATRRRKQVRARVADPSPPMDEKEAHRLAWEYRDTLANETQAVEKKCLNLLREQSGLPEGTRYEPLWDRTAFTAQDVIRFPVEEKIRRWFRLQTELDAVEKVLAGPDAVPWQKRLSVINRMAQDFARADEAWELHVEFYKDVRRGARSDDYMDCLAGWAAGEVGEQHLLPLLQKQQPEATRPMQQQQLLLDLWASVLVMRPAKLSVGDFLELPKAAAAHVHKLYRDIEGSVNHLQPAALRHMAEMNPHPPDPHEKWQEQDTASFLQALLATLPPRQRRTVDLLAEGYSYKQIAELMGCGLETVKTQLGRARTSLRKKVSLLGKGAEDSPMENVNHSVPILDDDLSPTKSLHSQRHYEIGHLLQHTSSASEYPIDAIT